MLFGYSILLWDYFEFTSHLIHDASACKAVIIWPTVIND